MWSCCALLYQLPRVEHFRIKPCYRGKEKDSSFHPLLNKNNKIRSILTMFLFESQRSFTFYLDVAFILNCIQGVPSHSDHNTSSNQLSEAITPSNQKLLDFLIKANM